MYFRIKPSIYADYGVTGEPTLPAGVSFKTGRPIPARLPDPLEFITDNTASAPPLHFAGINIPLMSRPLVETLHAGGIDNIDLYPAVLHNGATGERWGDYQAVNIIGMIACAVLSASEYVQLGKWPNGLPLLRFQRLVIDPARVAGAELFRLAESPSQILIHQRLLAALEARAGLEVWGVSKFPVEQT